ncbi:MAG: 2-hydroxyacid dehydrogenase [Lachnospiraceae bacterium]|nr:2-hydroxyacid dehydrogenase [Lachnospiraceae bacterium]
MVFGVRKISFYDTKPYDRIYFDELKEKHGYEIEYYEEKLTPRTAIFAKGSEAVIAFVNDDLSAKTLQILYENGVKLIAMRCAGYNNVDIKYAHGKMPVVRVPAYSPYAVAEHAMGMLLMLNRKLHKACYRVKEYNFSLNGLMGFDLYGKTVGIIGTGKIGRTFSNICNGFGMRVLGYDLYPAKDTGIEYVSLEEIYEKSDIISLHCPLTKDNYYMINKDTISSMKTGVYIINTSRGSLIDSEALMEALKNGKVGAAALDVYEEESDLFFEDNSDTIIQDDILARLISMPNVLVTSHQAFLTREALQNIAEVTLDNLDAYFAGEEMVNEVVQH